MIYRPLGKTGLRVSQLGFGAMRLPTTGEGEQTRVDRDRAIPMIHRAFAAGVNYIDTAVGYLNQDSQRAVGEALQGWRDKIVVSTKNPYYGPDKKEWWTNLENSLKRLRVDHIDIYNHHAINLQRYVEDVEPRIGRWMQEAKAQGLIKHIGTSFHDGAEALRRIIDSGYVEVVTVQYNLLYQALEDAIAYAHERGIGVVIMGSVGGGRLGIRSEVFGSMLASVKRVPELALRFVLSNPNVSVALSGMSTMQQVEENLAVANDPVGLHPGDKAAIREHLGRLQSMADLYCTGCRYCQPCESGVEIPAIFEHYNLGRVYGLWEPAKKGYQWLADHKKAADVCIECGECEDACPQRLPIREQLKEAHKALAEPARSA